MTKNWDLVVTTKNKSFVADMSAKSYIVNQSGFRVIEVIRRFITISSLQED